MYYDATYIILIPAIILTFWAQFKVQSNFNKYSRIRNAKGITGAQAARMMLDENGLRDIPVNQVAGSLTDHYDPTKRTVSLSQTVYGSDSIAAVAVACHEIGHAIQHSEEYGPLKFRNSIVPVVNLTSKLSWPLAVIGLVLLGGGLYIGDTIFMIGVAFFGAVVLFHLVTLPVELNASKRALRQIEELGIVTSDEKRGAKKVLKAAAMTYVAALATALANMLRLLALRNRN